MTLDHLIIYTICACILASLVTLIIATLTINRIKRTLRHLIEILGKEIK